MLAKERHDKTYDIICRKGAVSVSYLVKMFNVSIETVRRDLLIMEKQNLIKRVHGGAVKASEMKPFAELDERHKKQRDEKNELSHLASLEVCEGDFIAIDSGSTAIYFAEALKKREDLNKITVVTHSLDVFDILNNHKDFELILCGGNYVKKENAFCGLITMEMLDRIHVKKSFICPGAVSLEFGIFDYQSDLCAIQKKLMGISDKVYVLADSGKFEKSAPFKISDIRSEYVYITDRALKEELKILYRENGVHVMC